MIKQFKGVKRVNGRKIYKIKVYPPPYEYIVEAPDKSEAMDRIIQLEFGGDYDEIIKITAKEVENV